MRGDQSRFHLKKLCQPDFHLGLEFNVHVVLEQYHLEVECCNLTHIKWSRVSCNTLFLNHYYLKTKCMLNPDPSCKSSLHMTLSSEIHFGYLSWIVELLWSTRHKVLQLAPVSRTFFSKTVFFFFFFFFFWNISAKFQVYAVVICQNMHK